MVFPYHSSLEGLFAIAKIAKIAKLMRWHAEDRVNDGKFGTRLIAPSGELLIIVTSGHFLMK